MKRTMPVREPWTRKRKVWSKMKVVEGRGGRCRGSWGTAAARRIGLEGEGNKGEELDVRGFRWS